MGLKPAIFLDRDGVLNVNRPDYVKNETELVLFPWTPAAMSILAQLDVYIFVFTNQSAIGRGILLIGTAHNINNRLKRLIELEGGRIDGIYMCPHAPESECLCRKPKPGMIFQALHDYPDMDMDNIIIVGDQLTDLVDIPGSRPIYYLVQSGLPVDYPFEITLLEVAKQIWHAAQKLNTIATLVASN